MSRKKIISLMSFFVIISITFMVSSYGFISSSSPEILIDVIDNGGAQTFSEGFSLVGAIGQSTPPGKFQSDNYQTWGGYITQLALSQRCQFFLNLDASFREGMLELNFMLESNDPASWVTLLIKTYPSIGIIPLWAVPIPKICPQMEIPISFPIPDLGFVGIYSMILFEDEKQSYDSDWIITH